MRYKKFDRTIADKTLAATQFSHWTREMASMIEQTPNTTFPVFNTNKVRPLLEGWHVWDSWYVTTESGEIADVNGYRVLVGLARPVEGNDASVARIYFFYSKDKVHYTSGGALFDKKLYDDCNEWSGSTILRDDGKLQTFYTIAKGVEMNGNWQTLQRFATAIQTVDKSTDGLKFGSPSYHSELIEPDGFYYETAWQASEREAHWPTSHSRAIGSDQTENSCFRDPHFYIDKKTKKKYLVFEANTGPGCCPPGSIHRSYIGGNDFEPEYAPTMDELKANGCVGVLELMDSDYTLGCFKAPWLTANLVTDEIERINVIDYDNHVYLFVVGHGNKNCMVTYNDDLNNLDYMLGFRADTFMGALKPLNNSGVVVCQKSPGGAYGGQETNEHYVYSWELFPTAKTGVFDCTSYANFSFDVKSQSVKPVKTAGPTILVRISGETTEIVGRKHDILPMGAGDL